MKKKLILICDTKNEIDDQFAIVYALKSKEINLLGVVTTQNNLRGGQNSTDIYHAETEKILRLAKAKIACYKGATHPLKKQPEYSAGVKFIIDQITKSRDRITVACTGPCTDIINCILYEPAIAQKADFIWLGGFGSQELANDFNHSEVNFNGDKLAARLLLKADLSLTIIPFIGLAEKLVLNTYLFKNDLENCRLPLTNYLAKLIDLNWHRLVLHLIFPGIVKRYWVLGDLAAVAKVKNIGFIKFEQKKCTVENRQFVFGHGSKVNFAVKIDEFEILSDATKIILNKI